MKVTTREKGDLDVFAIWTLNGKWEPDWEPLRGHPITSLFTTVDKSAMEHALKGWSFPLIKALGIPPDGALRKLPLAARECGQRTTCASHDPKTCRTQLKKLPICYEPGGEFDNDSARNKASEAVQLWHEGVYVIVVDED